MIFNDISYQTKTLKKAYNNSFFLNQSNALQHFNWRIRDSMSGFQTPAEILTPGSINTSIRPKRHFGISRQLHIIILPAIIELTILKIIISLVKLKKVGRNGKIRHPRRR
jgi:hypothetical protein